MDKLLITNTDNTLRCECKFRLTELKRKFKNINFKLESYEKYH